MVLVESSVWIAGLRDVDQLIGGLGWENIAIAPPIVMEVQQGMRSGKVQQVWSELLGKAYMIEDPMPLATFELAAEVFRHCQDRGQASATVDCLIAACAIRNDVPLFTLDTDFERIAAVSPLRLFSRL